MKDFIRKGDKKMYKYPISLTQQFKMCGNAFRIDTYKGCTFGCNYCFATNRGGNFKSGLQIADFSIIEKLFEKAFEKDKLYSNINVEMLRQRVPLHLGGMSDPFQDREFEHKITYKLLQLSNKYNYPILISTKCADLPSEYWEVLNPNIHTFQISNLGYDDDFIRNYETNTPSAKERINFMCKLKEKGFWVSLRLQLLVNIEQAEKLILNCDNYVNYITIEHLKISLDNKKIKEWIMKQVNFDKDKYTSTGREYELKTKYKRENIMRLKDITSVSIGCADNDLHELSDSYNCCGIDTINDNFNSWIKYNSMYINMTNDTSQWYPKCSCQSVFNSACRKKGYDFKSYVDDYILKNK